jgi:glycosyltransferase involved in cell wall biosynthesis
MPKVSIVIPTYNRSVLLKEALLSICAQSETDWEAIVVNNFSDDDTLEMINTLNEPRISVINFRNEGIIGASRNLGVEAAQSDWIAFLDSDDTYHPHKLEKCFQSLGPGIDIVNHRFAKIHDEHVFWVSPRHGPTDAVYRNMFFKGNCLAPLTSLFRREVLLQCQGFSEERDLITAEDRDLWLRLAESGIKVHFIDDVLANYRVHDAGASRRIDVHLQASLNVINRHAKRITPSAMFDNLRVQRQRALVTYSAGRAYHAAGNRWQGIKILLKSLTMFPIEPRIYAALMIALTR